jgi:hypothetical protein
MKRIRIASPTVLGKPVRQHVMLHVLRCFLGTESAVHTIVHMQIGRCSVVPYASLGNIRAWLRVRAAWLIRDLRAAATKGDAVHARAVMLEHGGSRFFIGRTISIATEDDLPIAQGEAAAFERKGLFSAKKCEGVLE